MPVELVAARHGESFQARAAQRVADTTVAVVDGEVAGFVIVVADEVEQAYEGFGMKGDPDGFAVTLRQALTRES